MLNNSSAIGIHSLVWEELFKRGASCVCLSNLFLNRMFFYPLICGAKMTWRSISGGIALKNQVRQNTVHDHQNSGHNPPAALGWGPSRMGCAKAGGSCACACGSGPCMRLRPMRLRRRGSGPCTCACAAGLHMAREWDLIVFQPSAICRVLTHCALHCLG